MAEGKDDQQQLGTANIWVETVSATIAGGLTAGRVCPLLANFIGFDRLDPTIEICRLEEGVAGQLGCIRFCAGRSIESADGDGEKVAWVKERLNSIDHDEHKLSYEVVESNLGWGRYEAAMAVFEEKEEAGGGGGSGCRIEWSFEMDAVEGWSEEGFAAYLGGSLKAIVNNIEELCREEAQNIKA